MYKLHITQTAEADLFENALYIKNILHNEIAANKLIDDFYVSIQALQKDPKCFPYVKDDFLKSLGIHYIQIRNYTAFYITNLEKEEIFILRFLYSRRNWKDILGDMFLTTAST